MTEKRKKNVRDKQLFFFFFLIIQIWATKLQHADKSAYFYQICYAFINVTGP